MPIIPARTCPQRPDEIPLLQLIPLYPHRNLRQRHRRISRMVGVQRHGHKPAAIGAVSRPLRVWVGRRLRVRHVTGRPVPSAGHDLAP